MGALSRQHLSGRWSSLQSLGGQLWPHSVLGTRSSTVTFALQHGTDRAHSSQGTLEDTLGCGPEFEQVKTASQVWWYTSVVPELGRPRQEDPGESEAAWATAGYGGVEGPI